VSDSTERSEPSRARRYGDFTITRTEIKPIRNTGAIRLVLKLAYRARACGTVQLKVAATEGETG